MDIAVNYVGASMDYSGYASAVRAFICSLYVVGVNVTVEKVSHVRERTDHGWQGRLCEALQERDIPYRVNILHVTPDLYPNYIQHDKYNIGRLAWETDKLPKNWIDPINKLGEIWTSSAHMAELFKKSGVKVPVYWFPEPVSVHDADKKWKKFIVPQHEGFLFYSIFHWIERKDPKSLVTAYWEAFTGKRDVTLLIKTHGWSFDEAEFLKMRQDVELWKREMTLKHYPRVLLLKRLLTQDEMWRLNATGDCFVQVSRGEGWNRPLQEALLMGKPVISTSRGGIHEYLYDEHYFRVPSIYVPVTEEPDIPWYTADQKWAAVDKGKLKEAMLYAYQNRDLISAKGIVAKNFVKDQFSYHRVGLSMRKRLEEIYRNL